MTVAALLVMGVALSLVVEFFLDLSYSMITLFTLAIMASFFVHEIAHKLLAQKEGLWAEFRLTLMGAVLTAISAVLPVLKIISPGAVMISGSSDAKKIGMISIAGPATNIALSAIFLSARILSTSYAEIFAVVGFFNSWIALFNLIPVGVFDGFKVFHWNRKIWALVFALSAAMTVYAYRFLLLS